MEEEFKEYWVSIVNPNAPSRIKARAFMKRHTDCVSDTLRYLQRTADKSTSGPYHHMILFKKAMQTLSNTGEVLADDLRNGIDIMGYEIRQAEHMNQIAKEYGSNPLFASYRNELIAMQAELLDILHDADVNISTRAR